MRIWDNNIIIYFTIYISTLVDRSVNLLVIGLTNVIKIENWVKEGTSQKFQLVIYRTSTQCYEKSKCLSSTYSLFYRITLLLNLKKILTLQYSSIRFQHPFYIFQYMSMGMFYFSHHLLSVKRKEKKMYFC